jgi:RNA polymerase sigma factor (sigma-70 family)
MTSDDQLPGPPGQTPSPLRTADLEEIRADWISFFDAHFRRVVRLVMHVGASLQDAQDAAQEAFTESCVVMNADPARWAAVTSKEAWIRVVALRKYKRPPGPRIRLQMTDGAAIPDIPDSDPDPAELTVQTQMVLQALRGLNAESRAVMAFFLDGFSGPEIAAALGITDQKVRDVKKRARAALKAVLAAQLTSGGRESR